MINSFIEPDDRKYNLIYKCKCIDTSMMKIKCGDKLPSGESEALYYCVKCGLKLKKQLKENHDINNQ